MSETNRAVSFRQVSKIDQTDDVHSTIPVRKYISSRTGMRLYMCHIDGPVVEGYFSLATEAFDDDGLPHTLEHMIFLGSEDYPYSGVLDILANKIYAAGTNAWTAVDNTTYTVSTLERNGFLQFLPIYLDHILYPLLNESGFITEVYHVNEEGEDGGVVYSEMQSIEMEDENIVERAMHQAMYPDVKCPYRYETGGVLENLRTSCSHKKVCDYHRKMYRPDNMAIIVTGNIEPDEVIECLEKFEDKILSKQRSPKLLKLDQQRPFSEPIAPLTESRQQVVYFPSQDEANTNCIFSIGWRGPNIGDVRGLVAIDLLFYYLTDSSISPLQAHFINKQSYCNKIAYRIEEYAESSVFLSFTNTQAEHLEKIKPELDAILDDMHKQRAPHGEFDSKRMENIIKMKIAEINDKFEDSPHETISTLCIGDFLYGSLNDETEFKTRFNQVKIFESLKEEKADYWLGLLDKYLLKAHSITILARPSESLMNSIGEHDKQRADERCKRLGKKGLKELKTKLDKAIEQNDGCEVPDSLFDSLTVPSLENVKLKQLKQHFTYESGVLEQQPKMTAIANAFGNFDRLKHLKMQVDHLEGTNFVQVVLIIDTSNVDNQLRKYLQLLTNILFELPVRTETTSLTHEQVVYEINRDLLEFDTSLGVNGSQFDPGSFSQYLTVFAKVPYNDYELVVKWLKLITFNTVFDREQIKIAINNLLKEIKKRKNQPFDLMQSLWFDLYFKEHSNLCMNDFVKQETFLTKLLDDLAGTEARLDELRAQLLSSGDHLHFYMCADLNKLASARGNELDQIWLDYFPVKLEYNSKRLFDDKNAQHVNKFESVKTWQFKKIINESSEFLKTPAPKHDYLISLGSTESAFLRLVSSINIDSYHHELYPGLSVLIEYFTQAEGPLFEAVRGPGYCYHQSIHFSFDKLTIELVLDECSNLTKAYEATRKIFIEHLSDEFDANLFESAKNSLIFLLIDDLKSVSSYSTHSMTGIFKGIDINYIPELIKKIEKCEMNDMKKLLNDYLIPLFDSQISNCIIVCQPTRSTQIVKDFQKKFDRKLVLMEKLDESHLSRLETSDTK